MNDCALAIVIPVFNEEKCIDRNMRKLISILEGYSIDFRLVLVDDGSHDMSWAAIERLASEDRRVTCLRFSRNFGKEAAICAGLREVNSRRYLVMDSDLQHPPRYIPQMLELMDSTGCDIVDGVKASRGEEGLLYKFFAKGFYRLLKWVSGMELGYSSDFKLLDRKVVDALRGFDEGRIFFRGICQWVGFRSEKLMFDVERREGDKSHFSMRRRVRFAIDSVLSFTSKPLYITVLAAALFFLGALVLGVQTLFNYFSGSAVSGFTTVILLLLLIGSVLSASLAVIGAYISRIFDEVKARPLYIISQRVGDGK